MKKLFLCSLFLFSCVLVSAWSNNFNLKDCCIINVDDDRLPPIYPPIRPMSNSTFIYECYNEIQITSSISIENVHIKIYNGNGLTVYEVNTTSTVNGSRLIINTSNWAEGFYTIVINNRTYRVYKLN